MRSCPPPSTRSVDSFRARHPTLRAYTFFSSSGAASRLDALWWLPSPDSLTSVLNSSVLWHWDRRVDHEPVVVDLDISLPEVPETPAAPPPWRQLVRRLQTDLPSFVAASSSAKTATFRHVEAVLRSIQAEWDQLPSPPCEGMDGLLGQPSILVPQSLSARLSSAFDVLATSLLECLPPALPVGNHQAGRASAAWHACLLELRRLRRSLLDSLTPSTTHIRVSSFPLTDVWALWSKASDMERHLHSSGVHTPALPRWDSFSDSPLEWAGHLGFPAEVAADVLTVPGASSVVPPVAPVSWDSLPSSPAPSACLALVQTWIREAERRQAATTNRQCSTARARRLELLRLGDVKAWAKSMRPLNAPHSRFSPDWVRGADGTRRRPTAQADILQGSVQEWGRLLQEPVNFWSHEAVQPFSTSSAPRRGTLNFEVLAHAAAGSPLALVGQAMLHPGPWRLVPVCAADVRYLSPASLRVADWVLSLRGGNWFAARPMPCPGPLFVLLSFCGKPASEITLDHFRWPPADAVMVIREFSPPDTSAVSPTSTAERLSLCARFRHSRPGPSGWKVCYIEAFPPWLQDLYWTAIDLQRLTGIVAPSLQVAVQVHLAKPAGGWRPLSMLEEGLKSIEAPVAARLSNARLGCCLDHPFSHLNRAYAKGVPAAVQVLYLDCLVCEDALRHRRPLLRVPADY